MEVVFEAPSLQTSEFGRNEELLVLPFRTAPQQQFMLIAGGDGWRLPAATRIKGLCSHTSAAESIRATAGVSGRVFKHAIQCAGSGRRVRIHPLLVEDVSAQDDAARRWVSLPELLSLVSDELRSPLAFFANRRGMAEPKRSRHRR